MISYALVFVFNWASLLSNSTPPAKKYHPPLNIPLVLAANFGELRPNHFHMGLDFKTEAREGLTLHSIDDGYIARVTVSPYGYGRVVYINHPGGITSVYAHCQRLTGSLEEKVKRFQAKVKNSEADLYFQPIELPVKIGEVFALSGNTGASHGPHLHFEIRDTYTEEALNPHLFGFEISDHRAPSLYQVKIYGVDQFGYLFSGKTKEWSVKNATDGLTLDKGKVTIPAHFAHENGGIGFALNGIDKYDAAENTCGLYGTTIIVNGDTLMHQSIDKVGFSETRFLNAYTDYFAFSGGKKYHKAFHSVVNPLSIYKRPQLGILSIEPGQSYQVEYIAFDYAGNTTRLKFVLEVETGEKNTEPSKIFNPDYVDPMKGWQSNWEDFSVFLPMACTFEPIPLNTRWDGKAVFVSGDKWPVQQAFTVRLNSLNTIPIEKQYLAVNRGGGWSALTTQIIGTQLEAKSKYFGEVQVQVDTLGPTINPVNVSAVINSAKSNRMVWKMGDYRSGLMNYGLWVDGEWRVLDYESKGDYAFFELKYTTPGPHEMVIFATDFCGNTTTKTFSVTIE